MPSDRIDEPMLAAGGVPLQEAVTGAEAKPASSAAQLLRQKNFLAIEIG